MLTCPVISRIVFYITHYIVNRKTFFIIIFLPHAWDTCPQPISTPVNYYFVWILHRPQLHNVNGILPTIVGGTVSDTNRVDGQLAMSRAIGDYSYKGNPDISVEVNWQIMNHRNEPASTCARACVYLRMFRCMCAPWVCEKWVRKSTKVHSCLFISIHMYVHIHTYTHIYYVHRSKKWFLRPMWPSIPSTRVTLCSSAVTALSSKWLDKQPETSCINTCSKVCDWWVSVGVCGCACGVGRPRAVDADGNVTCTFLYSHATRPWKNYRRQHTFLAYSMSSSFKTIRVHANTRILTYTCTHTCICV